MGDLVLNSGEWQESWWHWALGFRELQTSQPLGKAPPAQLDVPGLSPSVESSEPYRALEATVWVEPTLGTGAPLRGLEAFVLFRNNMTSSMLNQTPWTSLGLRARARAGKDGREGGKLLHFHSVLGAMLGAHLIFLPLLQGIAPSFQVLVGPTPSNPPTQGCACNSKLANKQPTQDHCCGPWQRDVCPFLCPSLMLRVTWV